MHTWGLVVVIVAISASRPERCRVTTTKLSSVGAPPLGRSACGVTQQFSPQPQARRTAYSFTKPATQATAQVYISALLAEPKSAPSCHRCSAPVPNAHTLAVVHCLPSRSMACRFSLLEVTAGDAVAQVARAVTAGLPARAQQRVSSEPCPRNALTLRLHAAFHGAHTRRTQVIYRNAAWLPARCWLAGPFEDLCMCARST
jgi:hypothetical protein